MNNSLLSEIEKSLNVANGFISIAKLYYENELKDDAVRLLTMTNIIYGEIIASLIWEMKKEE